MDRIDRVCLTIADQKRMRVQTSWKCAMSVENGATSVWTLARERQLNENDLVDHLNHEYTSVI